jgi:Icc-related predicted phosphoesterase
MDDLHWRHGMGKADLILSCGDVYDQVILEAANAFNCPKIFAVRGNHDPDANTPFPAPIIDLHMTVQTFSGFTFGGLNGSWRYKSKGPFLHDQIKVCKYMSAFPAVDVLITHNSPRGIHDRDDGIHEGFDGLTNYIIEHKPKYLFHGHQHREQESLCDATRVICVYGWKEMDV